MSSTLVRESQSSLGIIAAKRMVSGILGRQYNQTLVVDSGSEVAELYKRVRPHKRGHLGRRRPEQKESLSVALAQLKKEGAVRCVQLLDGRMALTLMGAHQKSGSTHHTGGSRQPKRRAPLGSSR